MKQWFKSLGLIVFLIWLFGAVSMTAVYEFDRKKICIEKEGWLKGILWCSTDPGKGIPDSFIKGLLWPYKLLTKSEERL